MALDESDLANIGETVSQIANSGSFGRDQRLIRVECHAARIRYLPKMPRLAIRVDPVLRAHLKACLDGSEPWPLYLHGPWGVGKTAAALAICDVVRDSLYYDVAGFCDWLSAKMQDGAAYSVWEKIHDARLTVLDELGTRERPTEARWEAVLRFASLREWQPAIYVSNLQPDEFRVIYGERVFDRIMCGTVFELTGLSRR